MRMIAVALSSVLSLPVLTAHPAAAPQEGSAADVLEAARAALGAEALAAVESLSATGEYRRLMGQREISGDATIELILPDKLRRTEEAGIPGGPRFSRVTVLSGNDVWTDATTRGSGRGIMRFAGPGGPGTGGREMSEEDRTRMRQAQLQRMKAELARYRLALLLRPDAELKHVATAEAEDGTADVLEMTDGSGRPVRLFVDRTSHLPLMLTFEAPMPRMFVARGGQRPSPEEIERMRREPPQTADFELRFDEYREVKGVLLPHLIIQSANGNVNEEWTIEEYTLNPSLKPELFEKKASSN